MNLLIGENSLLMSLSSKYFLDSQLVRFTNPSLQSLSRLVLTKRAYTLSPSECRLIYDKTYQDATKPFGLVCQKSCNGKVETDTKNIHIFNEQLRLAISYIMKVAAYNDIIKHILRCVIPLAEISENPCLRKDGSGFSAHWLKGAVFLSLPKEHPLAHLELSINLVHELGHQSLMFYQDADAVISANDFDKPTYSAVRRTFRPAVMSVHALVAIYFMYYFVSEILKTASLSSSEKLFFSQKQRRLAADFAAGCFGLKGINFTSVGSQLILEMIEYFQQSRAA